MKAYSKVIVISFAGALLGGIIRLVTYLIYKTPAIEFDGSAGYSFVLAIIGSGLLFAIVGMVLVAKKKF